MERLWAPWRREYVVSHSDSGEVEGKAESACVFCDLLHEEDGKENLVLHRSERSYVVMNRYPYANGHLMVVPFRHVEDYKSLDEGESREIFLTSQKCVGILKKRLNADGFNVGFNLGRSAGAGIVGHLHMHIVPRWEGDHNLMPVLGGVRVIPESLDTTYNQFRPDFEI